jgi:hypothetical protein
VRGGLIRYWLLMLIPLFYIQCVIADDAVGRLFFTLEQRESLDRLREIKTSNIKQHLQKGLSKAGMQGYVKRNDGKQNTVWVDGAILQEDAVHDDLE